MPFVKFKGNEERDVPALRLVVLPNHTYEVPAEQMDGLVCQEDLWEETTATKTAPKAAPVAPDPDLVDDGPKETA